MGNPAMQYGGEVLVYAHGIVYCSVCAPKEMPVDVVVSEANRINPTGLKSAWRISSDETFHDGTSNPRPCNHNDSRTHYLLDC